MTGWPVLDVAIGLSFMFFVLSIVCSSLNEGIATALNHARERNLPLGWGHRGSGPAATPSGFGSWASKVAGILPTTFALTLGAPFWFDVLGRLFQIKGTGPKPVSTASTAAQPAKAAANG